MSWIRYAAWAILLAPLCAINGAAPRIPHSQTPRMRALPRLTVWAWERREDLRSLDPHTTAVAYLDRTITLDARGITTTPRRQPLLLPAADNLTRIPVVRIETAPGAQLNDDTAEITARRILEAALRNDLEAPVPALQIDFDAKLSERPWYRTVLEHTRQELPPAVPLSMTALASWCSYDGSWLRGLPVDEIVPMLFRMEPDRRQFAPNDRPAIPQQFAIRESACMGSVGISTREAWPRVLAGRRVYVFPDRGWQRDGLSETVKELW
ncbi:hypothetical protein [Edaphobacter albus]|uniref:hypothetical protein n=1 Tax=Edaphobacter sp. 4G125 TaxID=2763071 RepID=UPI001648CB00|nr:hypothetical protein [Edaphobacter sp. 4G125]QNI37033.1 hypothetical protein H7846_01445 [Edaphobacter sp. 4G125]